MTAQSEITGTRVLVAPTAIMGRIGRWDDPARKKRRIEWLRSLPHDVKDEQIAEALNISRSAATRWRREFTDKPNAPATRLNNYNRGVAIGCIGAAIAKAPWKAQSALEAHCVRNRQTMAEALVDVWVTIHTGEASA